MADLIIKDLTKSYDQNQKQILVIDKINLEVKEGEVIALVGPSGCGKSTILNILSGLIKPTDGSFSFDGSIGYMFQHDLLFDHLNLQDNVLIGLKMKRKLKKEDYEQSCLLLEKYGLKEFITSYPKELSGGMRQRVALLRTIITNPDLMLLDEPFSALDAQTRIKVTSDVYDMIKKRVIMTILVTHDISEAISFADRVIVLSDRPMKVKKSYEIPFKSLNPLSRRKEPLFSTYFTEIWNDINDEKV